MPGLFQAAREQPIGASHEFVLDEQLQKLEMREWRGFGLRDAPGQGFDHAGESKMAQARSQWDGHRRKFSKVYWVMGRIAGSSAMRIGGVARGDASASRRMVR